MELVEWLRNNKIKNIISVDDEHDEKKGQIDNPKYYVEKGLKENPSKFIQIYNTLDEFDEEILDEFGDNEKIKLMLQIYDDNCNNVEFEMKINALIKEIYADSNQFSIKSFLDNAKNEVDIKLYKSYSIAYNDYSQYINAIEEKENKILWLVDFDLGEGIRQNTGLKLIENIIKSNNEEFLEKNIFVLLTGYEIVDTNIKSIKCRVYKIDKVALKSTDEFIKRLVSGSKEYISWVLIKKLNAKLKEGFNLAEDEFLKRKQEILDYLIIQYPRKEGISTLGTLERILQIIAKDNFQKSLSSDINNIINMLNEYQELCDRLEEINSNYLFDLMKKETVNDKVNKFYKSINSGDIFKICDYEYILLSQPCDISVREKGDRNLEKGVLVKISNDSKSQKSSYELKHYKDEECYVNYRECKYVNLDILDLCTLNNDGCARIHKSIFEGEYKDKLINNDESDIKSINVFFDNLIHDGKINGYLNIPMRKKIFKILRSLCKIISVFDSLEQKDAECFKGMKEIINQESDLISLYSYKVIDGYVEFNIQRIATLDVIDTYDIINEFTNFNSRIGKPGDITAYIEDESKEIVVEELKGGKHQVIKSIKNGNNEDEISQCISELKLINRENISCIKYEKKKIIIPKEAQYLQLAEKNYDIKNGKIRIEKDVIREMDKQGVINIVLSKVAKDEEAFNKFKGILNHDGSDLSDYISLKIGKNKFGSIQLNVNYELDKMLNVNIGTIKIDKVS